MAGGKWVFEKAVNRCRFKIPNRNLKSALRMLD
jgi:hypothetical protein